ncbi:succinate dehydrogenase cytochrome b556 subunit [Devosia pacifica]|uniref:Succinate dehydrogenase cytochrome b556 subunit n=1 Tax=Devosia pacifica TaxID=1335967 RepID=A0A918S573_9HYPH|nr:succinate dehydrogenase, cytochrome b556 subunit [Devosia pacifica]GHA24554.1 succinate dehydrogenase cytochrome b556 subunit [Devosia pacifica]
MTTRPRPTSPHLSVYRFTITMTTSIVHRVTGGALYVSSALLALWLAAAAIGGSVFDGVNALYGSWFGMLVLFGYTWALFQHLFGGIRHFIWDSGNGFEPGKREAIAWGNWAASAALTLLVWIVFVWIG